MAYGCRWQQWSWSAPLTIAFGSYWGLVFVVPGVIVLASRIRDEEKLLREELDGYREYKQKVRYRLVPLMGW